MNENRMCLYHDVAFLLNSAQLTISFGYISNEGGVYMLDSITPSSFNAFILIYSRVAYDLIFVKCEFLSLFFYCLRWEGVEWIYLAQDRDQ